VRFLASTNRGIESVAAEEIRSLVGGSPAVHHPGMVTFEADENALYTLHRRARSLHRVLIERIRAEFGSLQDIYDIACRLGVTSLLAPDQTFAVRAKRHGKHDFGSPDVERVVGQPIVDTYRTATATRLPVDLDDPSVVIRVFVRHGRVLIAVDATGGRSLHRRWYRSVEHDAALRPTLAYAMLHVAGYDGTSRLVDPMCGAGTIPIEAALLAADRPPAPEHEPSIPDIEFLDADGDWRDRASSPETESAKGGQRPGITARDISDRWLRAARENASVAGVEELIEFRVADATAESIQSGTVVTDLPFGTRTSSGDLSRLYRGFFDALGSDWETLVLLTAREDLVPYGPARRYTLRRGRLEVSLLVIE